MLSYVKGNLFEAPVQTLVNTVNTEGVMGKGIALEFKRIFPEMFKEYQRLCENGHMNIGTLHVYRAPNKVIINFPTKSTWRKPSRLEYVEAGLQKFVEMYNEAGIHSVAFPPLGCGNGELDYADVRPLMESYLRDLPIRVFLYAPLDGAELPEHRSPAEMKKWLRSAPEALPFGEVWADLEELLAQENAFKTLARDTPITAELASDRTRIRINASGKSVTFTRDEIEMFWMELRDKLIVTAQSAIGRPRDVSYLIPVLAALPYLEVVEMSDTFDGFSFNPVLALQLVPAGRRAIPSQRVLVG